ncbi:MAG: endolytic transglycosylase MltG [Oscillospiraceae bacterium]
MSIILACLAWMFASDVLALNKTESTATITLPKSIFTEREVEETDEDGNVTGTETILVADMNYVATQLKDAEIINYKFLFELYSSISHADTKLDPGTYELSTDFDYRALVKKMTTGSPSQMTTKLTFPEGYTMAQIFSLLEENDICSKDDLYDAAANNKFSYSFLDEDDLGDATRLEGFLFPDTYDFYEGEKANSVIDKFLYNFYTRFTAEMIEKTEEKGLTIRQLVTIASLIEGEAAADDTDRYNIASVIYNRLGKNMPLQIDAAIQYILPERVPVLTEEQTSIDSPYNTYKYTGLPPSPIGNPGLASIKAALDPANTDYLYYALDTESGTHRFFKNYTDQQNFVATQDYGG